MQGQAKWAKSRMMVNNNNKMVSKTYTINWPTTSKGLRILDTTEWALKTFTRTYPSVLNLWNFIKFAPITWLINFYSCPKNAAIISKAKTLTTTSTILLLRSWDWWNKMEFWMTKLQTLSLMFSKVNSYSRNAMKNAKCICQPRSKSSFWMGKRIII